MPMKNSSDTIGNRTRDFPACIVVRHWRSRSCITESKEESQEEKKQEGKEKWEWEETRGSVRIKELNFLMVRINVYVISKTAQGKMLCRMYVYVCVYIYIYIPGIFPGVKGGRCVGLTTLPSSCANCLEIWERQPPGTLQACNGIALPFP